MKTFPLQAALAALALAAAGAAFAQPAAETQRASTRAQVQADLALWRQAGLDQFVLVHEYPELAELDVYQARMAEYQRLRNGPAYAEALRRYGAAAD